MRSCKLAKNQVFEAILIDPEGSISKPQTRLPLSYWESYFLKVINSNFVILFDHANMFPRGVSFFYGVVNKKTKLRLFHFFSTVHKVYIFGVSSSFCFLNFRFSVIPKIARINAATRASKSGGSHFTSTLQAMGPAVLTLFMGFSISFSRTSILLSLGSTED